MRNITEKQIKEFDKLTEKLMDYLKDNFNPHVKIIIDSGSAEMVEGVVANTK